MCSVEDLLKSRCMNKTKSAPERKTNHHGPRYWAIGVGKKDLGECHKSISLKKMHNEMGGKDGKLKNGSSYWIGAGENDGNKKYGDLKKSKENGE